METAPSEPSDAADHVNLVFLIGAAVVLSAFLYWRLRHKLGWTRRPRKYGRTSKDFVLGDWPVALSAIATPADIVRSFEHLSVLKIGPEALSFNHLAIASRLSAGAGHERCAAAQELATFYEQARYDPDALSFSTDQIRAVRHDIRLLAQGALA
jgi:hypothetical protein